MDLKSESAKVKQQQQSVQVSGGWAMRLFLVTFSDLCVGVWGYTWHPHQLHLIFISIAASRVVILMNTSVTRTTHRGS